VSKAHIFVQEIRYEGGDVRVDMFPNAASERSYLVKRALDVVLTLVLLITLAPLLLLIALLIRLDSPGPVLFVQERVGSRRVRRNGKVTWNIRNFPFLKFRSMYHGADQSVHIAHIKAFTDGTLDGSESFKLQNDPRITRIGHFLRKTSLDELPQLFNVLRGDMSLIGPRPVPTYEAAAYELWHHERHSALPGITGLWQVMGRSSVTFEEMIALDIKYVREQSLWLDLKILVRTVGVVCSGFGGG
jgi:lipopolysaccharide/colanic/teichoic acid biosynthesis glycosyltransferase